MNTAMAPDHQTDVVLHLGPEIPAVSVLYIDDDLLIIDKPATILSVPDRWDREKPNLMKQLLAGIAKPSNWATKLGLGYVANAHRLDKDTSGVFVIARTRPALASLVRQFRGRSLKKTYVALTVRQPAESPMTIDRPIMPNPQRPGLSMISDRGRPSVTVVEIMERFSRHCLVRARPETGRLHQVRIHLKAIGCPIACDPDYGSGAPVYLSEFKRHYDPPRDGERPILSRTALHAESIEFDHPRDGHRVRVEAPLPKDMAVAAKHLARYSPWRG